MARHSASQQDIPCEWATDTLITVGATEGIAAAFMGLVNPGDEVRLELVRLIVLGGVLSKTLSSAAHRRETRVTRAANRIETSARWQKHKPKNAGRQGDDRSVGSSFIRPQDKLMPVVQRCASDSCAAAVTVQVIVFEPMYDSYAGMAQQVCCHIVCHQQHQQQWRQHSSDRLGLQEALFSRVIVQVEACICGWLSQGGPTQCLLPACGLPLQVGAKLVPVQLQPPDWSIPEQQLRAAFSDKTKFILVNTPHNPTGKVRWEVAPFVFIIQ